ncbi:transporter substrate-binding domain-containing protein [Advenella sp. FME57]|uniref:transporter substrate-binding domain-containing protein n=1 Tax=Advenella sp. FME57 TaxID=2742604 RepID=UPI001867B0BC|nr:transporter substrate-binding domain-containing protein [Advenella sp. FME57]
MKTFFLTALLALGLAAPSLSVAADAPLRVVTDATFPPMEFFQDGKPTGFDIELMHALGKEMNRPIELTNIDFKGLIPAIVSGRADAAISGIYITPERKNVVDFTASYYAGGLVVLTKKDNNIKSIKDLDGKKVSVQVGTKSVNYLTEHLPNVKRVEVEKNEEMFNLVKIGRADAAVTGRPAAKLYAQHNPDFIVLDDQITTEEYGIAVSKSQPQVHDALNAALKKIRDNGTYQKIVDKWFEAKS